MTPQKTTNTALPKTGRRRSSAQATPQMPPAGPTGKLGLLVQKLRQAGGVTIAEMAEATGWQHHSVRGALSGSISKKWSLPVTSEKIDGVRRYSLQPQPASPRKTGANHAG